MISKDSRPPDDYLLFGRNRYRLPTNIQTYRWPSSIYYVYPATAICPWIRHSIGNWLDQSWIWLCLLTWLQHLDRRRRLVRLPLKSRRPAYASGARGSLVRWKYFSVWCLSRDSSKTIHNQHKSLTVVVGIFLKIGTNQNPPTTQHLDLYWYSIQEGSSQHCNVAEDIVDWWCAVWQRLNGSINYRRLLPFRQINSYMFCSHSIQKAWRGSR